MGYKDERLNELFENNKKYKDDRLNTIFDSTNSDSSNKSEYKQKISTSLPKSINIGNYFSDERIEREKSNFERFKQKYESQKKQRSINEQKAYDNVKKLEQEYKESQKWLAQNQSQNNTVLGITSDEYKSKAIEARELSKKYSTALAQYNEEYAEEAKSRLKESNKESIQNFPETAKKSALTVADAGLNTVQGLLNVPEGIADLGAHAIAQYLDSVGRTEDAKRIRQNAQVNVTQDKWLGKAHNYLDENSYLPETGDEIFQGVGYSATLAGLNLIPGAGNAISNATMASSAMGSSLNEAYATDGVSDAKAWIKAGLSAGLEVSVEKLFGVLGFGGSSVDDMAKGLTDSIQNGLVKAIAETGVTMTGEGIEEMLSYAGNYLIDNGLDLVDPSTQLGKDWNNQELWKNFFVGAMSAGVSQGPVNVGSAIRNQNNASNNNLPTANSQPTVSENAQPIEKTNQQNSQPQVANYVNETNVAPQIREQMQSVINRTNKISSSNTKLEFTQLKDNVKAQTDGNTIKVDISKASLGDVIHEITHNTESSKGYTAISDYILTELDKRGELQAIKDEINSRYSAVYEQEGRTFTEQDLESEIVANYTERFVADELFVNKITQEDRNFAQKIYDWIKEKVNYYKTVKSMTEEQKAEYDELRKAEKLWLKALSSDSSSSQTDIKYSFIGKNGMKNYSNNKYGDDGIQSLFNTAQNMKTLGASNERIRQATNWFQDKNGDWKFEFSDKDMSLRTDLHLEENTIYKLGEVLEHDTLFMAYPELANLKIKFVDIGNSYGGFNGNKNMIVINNHKLKTKQSMEATLIHEIQHAIQKIEGFERGRKAKYGKERYYKSLGEIEAADVKDRFLKEKNGQIDLKEIAPQSSLANPKHKYLDTYLKNRGIVDKVKDSVYNYFEKKGKNNEKNIKETRRNNYDTNSEIVLETGGWQSRQSVDRFRGNGRRGNVANTLPTVKNNKAPRYSLDEATTETTPKGKERKHYKSILTSPMVGEKGKEVAKNLLENDRYIPSSNQKQIDSASKEIENLGLEVATRKFRDKVNSKDRLTPQDIANGERLIQEYSRLEDYNTLTELIQDVAIAGTELGQTVQALSLIKKMTPAGQLVLLEKTIKRLNMTENLNIKLTPEQTKLISEAKNQKQLDEAMSTVAQSIAEQIPIKTSDKLRSWRYLAMLGNPRTHVRNFVSNVGMKVVMSAKNKVAGAMEDVFNPLERKRTLKRATKETKLFAETDSNEMVECIASGGKYDVNTLISQNKKQFKNKILNAIAEFNSKMLELEDKIFIKSAYKNALANYMTANKLTPEYLQSGTKEANIALTKAREFATHEAQVATFRQFSWLAAQINHIENKNNFTKVAVGGLAPFKKTPINIAKAGSEYSPIGLAKNITYDIYQLKKGNINASKFIDNISKGLTGTSISLIGYFLAQAGILKAGGDGNDREEDYEKSIGEQDYAIKIGDKTFTIDWLSPAAMPLLVGAEFYQSIESGKLTDESRFNAVATTLGKTFNPLAEMSMLQSFASTLTSYNEDGALGKIGDMVLNIGESYVGQFLPTALGQVARTVDDTERDTYYTDKTGYEARLIRFANKQIAKIPFASKTLQPRLNVWGEEVKRDSNIALRAVNQFLNPSYVKTVENSEADKAVQAIYKSSKDTGVLPKAFNSKFTMNTEQQVLSPEENTKYKKRYGQLIKETVTEVAQSKEYASLPTAQKAETIKAIYSDSNDKVKGQYATKNNIEYDSSDDIDVAIKRGLSKSNAYIYRGNINDIDSDKDRNGETIGGSRTANRAEYIMKLPTAKDQKNLMLGLITDSKVKPTVKDLETIGEANYTTYFSINDSESREKYVDLASTGMNSSALYKYIQNIGDIKGQKDANGKTINGSVKTAKANYINSLNLSREEKLLLFAKNYPLTDSEKSELMRYINNLKVSSQQKLEIVSQLKGFEVKNGRVYW